jgi:hypothetical protein
MKFKKWPFISLPCFVQQLFIYWRMFFFKPKFQENSFKLGEIFFPTFVHFFNSFWGVNCSPIFLRFFIQSFCQLALNFCFWSQYILHQHQEIEENIYLENWVVSALLGHKSTIKLLSCVWNLATTILVFQELELKGFLIKERFFGKEN